MKKLIISLIALLATCSLASAHNVSVATRVSCVNTSYSYARVAVVRTPVIVSYAVALPMVNTYCPCPAPVVETPVYTPPVPVCPVTATPVYATPTYVTVPVSAPIVSYQPAVTVTRVAVAQAQAYYPQQSYYPVQNVNVVKQKTAIVQVNRVHSANAVSVVSVNNAPRNDAKVSVRNRIGGGQVVRVRTR